MSIGSRIKELRENKNISRTDFASMIGVTVGAISNYENDVSSPKEPILFKIIEALDCDANYLFQDMVKIKSQNNDVTLAEYDFIKKYRSLSDHGKIIVDYVLESEYLHTNDIPIGYELLNKKGKAKILDIISEFGGDARYNKNVTTDEQIDAAENLMEFVLNAANARTDIDIPENVDTSDNDIMDDENF